MNLGWHGALIVGLALATPSALAQPIEITAVPVSTFKGAEIGQRVDQLIWRGGLVLDSSADTFGGISGVTFVSEQDVVMVSDRGNFISARIDYDDAGIPNALSGAQLEVIRNSSGTELPSNFSRDSEAVETVYRNGEAAAVRVGFENLTRVADFDLVDNRPSGAARIVSIPDELESLRTNESLEAVCIAPPASPVAGSTVLIAEQQFNADDNHSAWLLGNRDKGPLALVPADGYSPTDCDFLPNGDLLVLERGMGFLSFIMQVRRIPAETIGPGAVLQGDVILSASGGDIDNMEGIAVRELADGSVHIVIMSDDNFNDWERTLWLEFALPN